MDASISKILSDVKSLRNETETRLQRIEDALIQLQRQTAESAASDAATPERPPLTREDIFFRPSEVSFSDGWDNPLFGEDGAAAVIQLPKREETKELDTIQVDAAAKERLDGRESGAAVPTVSFRQREASRTVLQTLSERYGSGKRAPIPSAAADVAPIPRYYELLCATGTIRPETRAPWDVFMSVAMVWVCVMSPYVVCFGDPEDLPDALRYVEFFVDICFLADIFITLNTGFIDEEGHLVCHRWRIIKRYAKTWLMFDVVSVLPLFVAAWTHFFDSNTLQLARMTKLLKIIRLIKTLRLLRITRLQVLWMVFENILGTVYLKVAGFMVLVALLSHWGACLFHWVAYLNEDSDTITWIKAAHLEDCNLRLRYLTSLYWSLATMTSVGYGDVVARTNTEKAVSVVVMLIGVSTFAYIMATVTSLIGALNSTSARIAAKQQRVDDFLRARMVPAFLSNKVREFYNYTVMKEFANDDSEIIGGLPSKLRTQIILFLFRDTLAKVLYFENKAPQFIAELVMMMKIEFYSPGDFVVVQGEMSTEMYIVVEGRLSIRAYEHINRLHDQLYCGEPVEVSYKTLGHIEMGSQFGEYACLTNEPRTATVVAETYCELYSLSREGLNEVMDRWPQYKNEISKTIMKKSKRSRLDSIASAASRRATEKIRNVTIVRTRTREMDGIASGLALGNRSSTLEIATVPAVIPQRARSVISIPAELQPYLHAPTESLEDEARSLLHRLSTDQ